MVKIERFYGSCSHIVDKIITEEEFSQLTKPFMANTLGGKIECFNLVTEEDNKTIVHVHPHRFCVCINCMKEVLIEEECEFQISTIQDLVKEKKIKEILEFPELNILKYSTDQLNKITEVLRDYWDIHRCTEVALLLNSILNKIDKSKLSDTAKIRYNFLREHVLRYLMFSE